MIEKRDRMIKLYKEGLTYESIGELFGVTRQRIHQIISGYVPPSKLQKKEYKEVEIVNVNRKVYSEQEVIRLLSGFYGLDRNRERVRIRDNWTCQSCGKVWKPFDRYGNKIRRFDVHHEDEHLEGRSGENGMYAIDKESMDRMITLCHKCHLNLLHIKEKMKLINRNGWKNPNRKLKSRKK